MGILLFLISVLAFGEKFNSFYDTKEGKKLHPQAMPMPRVRAQPPKKQSKTKTEESVKDILPLDEVEAEIKKANERTEESFPDSYDPLPMPKDESLKEIELQRREEEDQPLPMPSEEYMREMKRKHAELEKHEAEANLRAEERLKKDVYGGDAQSILMSLPPLSQGVVPPTAQQIACEAKVEVPAPINDGKLRNENFFHLLRPDQKKYPGNLGIKPPDMSVTDIVGSTFEPTLYHTVITEEAKSDEPSAQLLDGNGKPLGERIPFDQWCDAAMEGSVIVVKDGKQRMYNAVGSSDSGPRVECKNGASPTMRFVEVKESSPFGLSRPLRGSIPNLVPFRTIAVPEIEATEEGRRKRLAPFPGDVVFVPEAVGKTYVDPDGTVHKHDGWFFTVDIGRFKKTKMDFFTGFTTQERPEDKDDFIKFIRNMSGKQRLEIINNFSDSNQKEIKLKVAEQLYTQHGLSWTGRLRLDYGPQDSKKESSK